jgi:hypothetical protein
MENIKPRESEKQLLDGIAMDFQNLAESFQQKGAGEDMHTLARTMMRTIQKLRDSDAHEFTYMREYIKKESNNIKNLVAKAISFSTESQLEDIKKELQGLDIHIQHKGILDNMPRD